MVRMNSIPSFRQSPSLGDVAKRHQRFILTSRW